MPYRQIRPFPSNYSFGKRLKPADGWPERRMWVARFEDDHLRLKAHPVWMLAARLTPEFRALAEDPSRRFEAWEMSHAKGEPAFALYYGFRGPDPETMPIAWDPDITKRMVDHVVMLMGADVFLHGRETQAFSWTVDLLEGRDPWTARRLAPEPQGEIPAEDEAALTGLGV